MLRAHRRNAAVLAILCGFLAGCDNPGFAPPSLVITSVEITSPLDGFRVLGDVVVAASVTGSAAPDSAVLEVDGARVAGDTAPPWVFPWTTTDLAEGGAHTLVVSAYDEHGRVRRSNAVRVTLSARTFEGDYGIFTMNADGSNLRQIDTLDVSPRVFPISPDVSPDGFHIAFTGLTTDVDGDGVILPGGDDTGAENFVIDADGGNLRRFSHDTRIDQDARWADNNALLYATNRVGSDLEIFLEQVLGGSIVQNRTVTGAFSERYPSLADSFIYHTRFDAGPSPGTGALWKVHRLTRNALPVLAEPSAGSPPSWLPAGDLAPELSPDGSRLAFSRSLGGAPGVSSLGEVDLRVFDITDSTVTSLSAGAAAELFPRWSPDGSRILIVTWSTAYPAGGRIELVDPMTGAHTALGPLPAGLRPVQAAWFPDAMPDAIDAAPDIVFTGAREALFE